MKVIRLHAPNDLRLHEEPEPVSGPGEALLRVQAVGICGSDLHWFGQAGIGDAKLKQPLVPGHEFAGVIAAGARQGERVAIDAAVPCHACEFCLQGNPNLCEHMRFAGHGLEDGALREFIAWQEDCLFPLPEKLSVDDGVMLDRRRNHVVAALAIRPYHALDRRVVAFRSAAREDDLAGPGAKQGGHRTTGPIQGLAGSARLRVEARRIAELLAEVGKHRLDNACVDGCRRGKVQIDGLVAHVVPSPYMMPVRRRHGKRAKQGNVRARSRVARVRQFAVPGHEAGQI